MLADIERLKEIIAVSRRIVFFGGAGVSTASGIPDFRSADGLYSNSGADRNSDHSFTRKTDCYSNHNSGRDPEEMLSALFFATHTTEFFDFYRSHMVYPDAKPNVIHRVLYEWEKQDKLRAIVTQNIDGLHKAAGNKRVYELHGSIYENYCVDCETSFPLSKIMETDGVPRCDRCGGVIKPYVVLYGEQVDKYTSIGACREISNADTMIIAGTSLAVEPAASYIDYFSGRNLIVINKTPTPADERATLLLRGDAAEIFTALAVTHAPQGTDPED
ncbi:MAG: NAD-dependent protein deacylase [Mogibacterium sp.]|nr:NAD-dependent protein deacylase [Mogibacterium sp.]